MEDLSSPLLKLGQVWIDAYGWKGSLGSIFPITKLLNYGFTISTGLKVLKQIAVVKKSLQWVVWSVWLTSEVCLWPIRQGFLRIRKEAGLLVLCFLSYLRKCKHMFYSFLNYCVQYGSIPFFTLGKLVISSFLFFTEDRVLAIIFLRRSIISSLKRSFCKVEQQLASKEKWTH